MTDQVPARVAVIGLGSMGLGMAQALAAAGHDVVGTDVSAERRAAFADTGGQVAASASAAAAGAEAVVIGVVNAAQVQAALEGSEVSPGALATLAPGAVVIASATVAPDDARRLAAQVESRGHPYLDAPMSGGPDKASAGRLTMMASGSDEAFSRAQPFLEAMTERLFRVGEAPGEGSAIKLVNQLLAGVHIAAACEAVAMGVRLGLDPARVYEVISNAAGASWMFNDRVPHILAGDYAPKSAVGIFIKDLGIVMDTARSERFPTPLAATALSQFLAAASAGFGEDDDSSVVRVFQRLSGIPLPGGETG